MSRDAASARLDPHATTAAESCPSLNSKNVTAHTLRRTARRLLSVGIDTTVIALWLSHEIIETTQVYLHADVRTKEKALARTRPTGTRPGRYRPQDDNSWPSSKPSDYADLTSTITITAPENDNARHIGITGTSA